MVKKLAKVRKRDGREVQFDQSRIIEVIWKAAQAIGGSDRELAEKLAENVVQKLTEQYAEAIPTVENIQDVIERVLIEHGHTQTAKAFILYRKKRQELREAKSALGVEDDMKLSFDGLLALTKYKVLRKTAEGKLETTRQLFQRVASALSKAEKKYGGKPSEVEQEFTQAMLALDLLPSVAILRNAGTNHHLSESFVLPLQDDTESLFDTLKRSALLHKSRQRGFGLGLSFSLIRQKGSPVGESVGETAAGPVAFLLLYDRALHQLNPYGTNMAFLSVHHPDVVDFITAKDTMRFHTFGTSVVVSRDFMAAVHEDKKYKLLNPSNQAPVAELRARSVFDMLATIAWRTGDPAIVFYDNLNKAPSNPFGDAAHIEATTPTGEHPLFFYESSFTASINLAHHVVQADVGNGVNWEKLRKTVSTGVRLLDNAIDISSYPSPEMKSAIERTRRIGLGVMGWADMLLALRIPYNSPEALALAEKLMVFVSTEAKQASAVLAKERGTFAGFKESVRRGEKVRHAARTTIMNSGILSMIAGCSQGIEPHYAVSYMKRTPTAETFEVLPQFEALARREGFYSAELMKRIALAGSVQYVEEVPVSWRKLFFTAHDCSIHDHLAMQIAFQKHTDNGVSKTINLPVTATINEVEDVIRKAYRAGCRSVHIYREGSSSHQLIQSRYNGSRSRRKRVKVEV